MGERGVQEAELPLRTKIFVIALSVVAVLQAAYLVHVDAVLAGKDSTIELLRENIGLRELLCAESAKICAVRVGVGEAYREVFHQLIVDLGIYDKRPVSTALRVLTEAGFGGPG